ncbi:dihydroneopterin aldolase [Microbulbifer litoralis]|uniref:dihydroneopterin aldolase n=1 Tax=Microbulbifer litoralis TaxID=2933965 RepID=UPI002028E72B|nr:dihydroneopterin aldolase [Microbulbifer sp. GX H0434]
MDIVYIRDLKVDTIIGIYDWEREVRQTVSLDLEMAFDISEAARTDDIAHTLNYKAVAKRLIAFIEGSEFLLVETMAEQAAAIVRDEFNVGWLRLRLSKPGAVRGSRDVGVIIERGSLPAAGARPASAVASAPNGV